jgi:hypothetical protein
VNNSIELLTNWRSKTDEIPRIKFISALFSHFRFISAQFPHFRFISAQFPHFRGELELISISSLEKAFQFSLKVGAKL